MNMRFSTILAAVLCFFLVSTAAARPKKGFHTGPYLALEGGVTQVDFDYDEVDGRRVGNDFEPTAGFIFGWNVRDDLSAEMQLRYATNTNAGRREHIASANVYARWTMIFDVLTDFKDLRVLPFLKGGAATRISGLPGNPGSSDGTVGSFGIGPSAGGGIAFLAFKYFYFGFDLHEDILFFDDINQTVNGVPGVLVYKGGFHPSFNAMAILGVHY